jgi:ankyrin repeat protein
MKQLFDPSKPHFAVCVWIHDPEDPTRRGTERAERPLQLTGTPLHYAALWGLHGIREFLIIEHSQDMHSRRFTNMVTPLHLASKKGHSEAACSPLEHGADVVAQDKDKWTPPHRAPFREYIDVAQALIDHSVDVTAQDRRGLTPSHLAAGGHCTPSRA